MAVKRETKKIVPRPSRAEMADLFDGLITAPQGDALNDLKETIEKTLMLCANIEQVKDMLKALESDLNQKLTKFIPDAMRAVNMTEFVHASGMKVKLKDFLSGTLPKDPEKRTTALKWIHANGGRDLIRNKFNIELERGDEKTRKGMIAALRKVHVDYQETVDVNHNSMLAWVRERMENGMPTPLDTLGIYAGVTAKIEPPKVKKAKAAPVAAALPAAPSKPSKAVLKAKPAPKSKPSKPGKSAPPPKTRVPSRRRENTVNAGF